MPLDIEVGLGDSVLDGDPAPLKKGVQHPLQFAMSIVAKTAGWNKMPLDWEVGLGPGDTVLDGDPAPLKKWGTTPAPIRHVQTAGWIKMPLSTEVGLGGFLSDGDPAALDGDNPIFGPCPLWMD